jgi:hypothetical protein
LGDDYRVLIVAENGASQRLLELLRLYFDRVLEDLFIDRMEGNEAISARRPKSTSPGTSMIGSNRTKRLTSD